MITEPIIRFLKAQAAITSRLSVYNFTTGGADPAIFSGDIPSDAKRPAITVIESNGQSWGARQPPGWECNAEIRVFGDKTRTDKQIRDLADLVATLIHRQDLEPPGYACWGTWATPPQDIVDDNGFPGYSVRVRVLLLAL